MEKICIKKELYILNYEFLKFYALFWFFIWFLFIFSLLKSWKGGLLPAGADVVSGPSGKLTRGTRDHRTGATRGWGHVAEPWVAHAVRRRRIVCGHATTWAPAWGAMWQEGDGSWRGHGFSGALVREGGGNTIN